MEDDLQRFRLFNAAVRLVTKSTDEPGQELSEQMASLITDITSLMWTVVRKIISCKFIFFSFRINWSAKSGNAFDCIIYITSTHKLERTQKMLREKYFEEHKM